jgi:hypothetical protein
MTSPIEELKDTNILVELKPVSVGKGRIKIDDLYTSKFSKYITFACNGPVPMEVTVTKENYMGDFDELWNRVANVLKE